MEKKIEIIAVDFDGTLCSECYPAIGMPNLPLFALLKGARRHFIISVEKDSCNEF